MTGVRPPLLLLSDVDGTLLGDDGALPASPRTLRSKLHAAATAWNGPLHVGLASSRTLRELTVLQRALQLPGPCIAEDGARHALDSTAPANSANATAEEQHGRRRMRTFTHALTATALRECMHDIPAFGRADTQGQPFTALQALGFRTPAAVRRALHARTHSVLLDPQAWTPHDVSQLRAASAARGLQLRRGGRWFTLTTAGGKGPALRALQHQFSNNGVIPVVVAIGNEENDVSLLAEADGGFVIRNPHRGPHPVLSALPRVVVLDSEGPGGWMEMLDRLVPYARLLLEARQ
jgi:mannosyl-3-phosphoglycerate phosphatase